MTIKIMKNQRAGYINNVEPIYNYSIFTIDGKHKRKNMSVSECKAFIKKNNAVSISPMQYYAMLNIA